MFNELFARITTWAMAAREESGQGLVEYALILVLVSIAAIAALTTARHRRQRRLRRPSQDALAPVAP